MPTRTRADLSAAVARAVKRLTRREADAVVDDVLEEITAALVRGEQVKLTGFATFTPRHKEARVGRNPWNPEIAIEISPRRVVSFKPSRDVLREKVIAASSLKNGH